MKKVEIYFSRAKVLKNGDRRGNEEDLAVLVDWDKPSTLVDRRQAVQVLTGVKPNIIVMPDKNKPHAKIRRQMFKIQVEGTSLIEVRLLRIRDVTAVEKGLVVLLKGLVGIAASATGIGIAPLIASTLTSFVKASDKITRTLGVAEILIDEAQIDGSKIRVDLGITPVVRESLLEMYQERRRARGSTLSTLEPMKSILSFLRNKKSNGYVEFEVVPLDS